MSKKIEPDLKSIGNYLNIAQDEQFVIPAYQRGYSWEISQCEKLWQDIESFIQSSANEPYFFGTIIVDCSTPKQLQLIDGQQRTTTFLLLLKALLIKINEVLEKIPDSNEAKDVIYGLQSNRDEIIKILYQVKAKEIPTIINAKNYTKSQYILSNQSINEFYKKEIINILKASDYDNAEQAATKIPRKQKDNKYTNHFRNFKYFYEKLSTDSTILLNFAEKILEECQVIEIRSWQTEQAITMFNSLNATGMPLADADIISAQLYKNAQDRATFDEAWQQLYETANTLKAENITTLDGLLQQLMYINRAADMRVSNTTPGLRRYYTEINKNLLDNPIAFTEALQKIADIWLSIKDNNLIKLLLNFNENAKLFLMGYLYRFEPQEASNHITEITISLLRLFAILELTETGYSSKKFKSFLFEKMGILTDINQPIENIKQEFNTHINKEWQAADIEQACKDYEKNTLVYLNEYLFSPSVFAFYPFINIEHIMPASGKNIKSIQKDAEIDNVEEFKALVNKLGNKILLEANINQSISNEWFRGKKQNSVKDKTGYKDSQYQLAQALTEYHSDTWTKSDIETATEKAAERICNFIFNGKS